MKLFWPVSIAVAATVFAAGDVHAQSSRDQIRISGSSTVYPFSTVVAESLGKLGKFKSPVVESVGTGGGFKLFCSGVGPAYPDISNASRPITASEREACAKNGVGAFTEVKFGFDGISVGQSTKAQAFELSRKVLFLAVAAQVPVNGKLAPNPYRTWADIDPTLPRIEIEIYGPSPVHGTRDAFNELVMDKGCEALPEIKALPKDQMKKVCNTFREDGVWTDVSEDYSLIVNKLANRTTTVGVFTFSYIDQNKDKVRGLKIDGVEPTFDNIAGGLYPISRPLFFYVKNAHLGLVPGVREFVTEFLSDKALGEDGYLIAKGLIPLPETQLKALRAEMAAKLK
ncbi:phosphate transport system substrate-binding protein [uncultured Gammaproteobacteria bacterium]